MKEYIELRVLRLAEYIVETGDTVRGTSKVFGVSKSTIHKDVSQRLFEINPLLAKEVRRVLLRNKAESHLRGGKATQIKYLKKRKI